MKKLVVIPTYNERENILPLIQQLFESKLDIDVLVVDDNSPDGTGDLVRELKKSFYRLHLLSREQKQGLGRAYLAGFKWGLDQGYDWLIEMDADFSHRPEDLAEILKHFAGYDFIIGSRYVAGGKTVNWGLGRKVISQGGSLYARWILGFPLRDWTGGFNAWSSRVLLAMGLDQVQSDGYSFQIELKFRAMCLGFSHLEVPIVFEDRRVGQSKMSSHIVFEALYRVLGFRQLRKKIQGQKKP